MCAAAAALFGVSVALASKLAMPGWAAWGVIGLIAGGTAMVASRVQNRARPVDWTAVPRKKVALAAFGTALGNIPYFAALQLGPVGPNSALHLCAPVILLAAALIAGRRPLRPREIAIMMLLVCGIAMFGLMRADSSGAASTGWMMLSFALSLLSAAGIAIVVTVMHGLGGRDDVQELNGMRVLVGVAAALPLLAFADVSSGDLLAAAGIGLLQAPAVMLQMAGLRRLDAVTASSLSLVEAPVGAAVAAALFGAALGWVMMLGVAAVLAGVLLEVSRR